MAQLQIELFGHIAYHHELSYHDMLNLEESFKLTLQSILDEAGAEFINFEPQGDILRFQCMFAEPGEARYHDICDKLAEHVTKYLDVRLLFVDKDFEGVYFYSIARGTWQEAIIAIPPPGYLAETKLV